MSLSFSGGVLTYDACGGSGWNDLDHAAQLTGNFGKNVCSSKQTPVEPNTVRGCNAWEFVGFPSSCEALHFLVGVFGVRNAESQSMSAFQVQHKCHKCITAILDRSQPVVNHLGFPGSVCKQSIETFESESARLSMTQKMSRRCL